jgi:hypothetical protein
MPQVVEFYQSFPPMARMSIVLFLVLVLVVPMACRRCSLPSVVGLLISGIVIGYHGLRIIPGHHCWASLGITGVRSCNHAFPVILSLHGPPSPYRVSWCCLSRHIPGNAKQRIFRDDRDRRIFLGILDDAVQRFHFICHAYCLMDNHYHLVIETPEGNLSKG